MSEGRGGTGLRVTSVEPGILASSAGAPSCSSRSFVSSGRPRTWLPTWAKASRACLCSRSRATSSSDCQRCSACSRSRSALVPSRASERRATPPRSRSFSNVRARKWSTSPSLESTPTRTDSRRAIRRSAATSLSTRARLSSLLAGIRRHEVKHRRESLSVELLSAPPEHGADGAASALRAEPPPASPTGGSFAGGARLQV
jgi:hypothetical protein